MNVWICQPVSPRCVSAADRLGNVGFLVSVDVIGGSAFDVGQWALAAVLLHHGERFCQLLALDLAKGGPVSFG